MKLRSVTGKILIWSLTMIVLSLGVFSRITKSFISQAVETAFSRTDAFELSRAIYAHEHGGKTELANYLEDLHRHQGPERYVTDAAGRDLLSGVDRSALLAGSENQNRSFQDIGDRIAVVTASHDGRYRYIVTIQQPFGFSLFAPHYLLLLAVVAGAFWALALHFAWPLRRLASAVRRFGGGDLAVRVGMNRRDEIGELGRAFDNMAERIQTLLTAERQLLQDVSHELRSPLARLSLAADLVGKAGDREAAAQRVRRETERLSSLVTSLLQMTAAEGDPEAFSLDDVCLSDLLREVALDSQLEAEERRCRVEVEAPEDAMVLGDAEMLQRAIENILRNAIRYSPEGAPVEVKIAAEGTRTVLTIRDHGPGVPEELLPKIFNPFFRVDESRDCCSGGLGLGLAIAQRAIRLHHGEIRAENAKPGLRVEIVLQSGKQG